MGDAAGTKKAGELFPVTAHCHRPPVAALQPAVCPAPPRVEAYCCYCFFFSLLIPQHKVKSPMPSRS